MTRFETLATLQLFLLSTRTAMLSPTHETPPTKARFVVAAWLCGLSGILYLDRICMSQAVVPIQRELDLSNTEVSLVLMAFTLAYGIFAVPAGWLGDRFGPRRMLSLLVVAWSAFTALTGMGTGLAILLVARFLFGASEAGAFPNVAKVMARWFPPSERGRMQGVMLAFAQIGAVVSPFLAAETIAEFGWRTMFLAFAALGFVWAIGFWWWFRDNPANHRGVNEAELARIHSNEPPTNSDPGSVPWRAVATNRGILVLSLIMVFGAFFTYFFYSWFQKYLHESRGVENRIAGWYLSFIMAGSAVGMLFGGWLADRIPRWADDPIHARRSIGVASYLTAAACLFLGVRCDDSLILAGLWGASFCAMHVTLPNWWSVAIPQAGRHTATLFALMNGLGVLGAMASQGFVGVFADWQSARGLTGRAQWDPLFDLYVCVLLGGAAAWWMYRFTPLDDPPPTPPREESW